MSFVRLLGISMVGFGLFVAACSDAKGRGGGGGDDDDDNGDETSGGEGSSGGLSGGSGDTTTSGDSSSTTSSGETGATSGGSCTACTEECGFWACNCPNGDVVNAVACVNDCCLSKDEACAGACPEPSPDCIDFGGACDFDSDCCSDTCSDGYCG